MAHNEKRAGSDGVYLGVDWNYTSSATTLKIAPTVWRWDAQNTNNSGGRFWEALYPEPDGSTGGWTGLAWGSGSGWRKVDTFATRTYTRTHNAKTVTLDVGTDASFGTYYGSSFITIGSLTRSWTITVDPLASYTVSFNANNGSGAPSAQTKWYGETLKLSTDTPTRTNHVFKNWNTKSDGTGTAYAAGANYTGNAALTLYAQWYAPYTVSFNANSGSGAPGNQTKVYNTPLKLSTTQPTRTGYTFKGWATTQARANAGTVDYSSGANYTANASATLYAVWQINTWSVTYDGNGATGGSTSSQTKTYNQALTLRTNGFTRTNYNFVKWNTAANGSGRDYDAGGTLQANVNNAVKLYAQWKVAHSSPAIQSITVKRCDADGTDNVEGTRMHVVATWNVDNTTDGFTDTTGSTFKVTLGGTTDTVNLSGTSGTVNFVHSATAAIGSSYIVTSVLADSKGYSTTKTSTLSVAYFTMHFKAGGTGVGIGKPATEDNLLDVGMETRFNALATAQGTTSSSVEFGSTNPRFRFSNVNASQNGELVFTDYDAIHTGATLAWITNQPQSWFHTQHIKMTGNADVDGTVAKRWAAMNYSTAPSSTIYAQPTTVYDNAGNVIGHDEYAQTTAKSIQHNFAAVRQYNGSAWAWYQCSMTVSSSGAVTYSIHTPAAFRNAIGASSGTWPVSIGGTGKTSGTFYGATRIYSSTATCATFTLTSSVANYTWLTIQYRGNDGFYTTTTVFNNKAALNVALFVIESTANASVNIKRVTYTFSGTSATVKTYGEMDGPNSATASKNVTVTGVWGWV